MRIHRIPLLLAGLLLLTVNLKAGHLDQQLLDRISTAKPEERISVLIEMTDQVDMPGLKAELKAKKANLAETHKRVIESLKEKADKSQKDLINYLAAAKNSGRISDFKPFWISNLMWAKAPTSEIEAIAKRRDVEAVFLTPKVEIVKPVEVDVLGNQSALVGVEPGLKMIHAPQLWSLGYRGKGILVCNIDTGVHKNHGALSARWRGNFLQPPHTTKEAWYDPVYGSSIPLDDQGGSAGHGTMTMGIMCGCNPATGDTVGVAIEAQWIAARAIDVAADWPVEIGALQWSADPDDDPNTLGDVPDVVNNSWGLPKYGSSCSPVPGYTPCWEIYWQVLDNVSAAGPVVVFAAGNEGTCTAPSLRVPADRIASDYNVFAVGSVAPDSINVSSFSSRGPSPCDGVTKKPEVVAPGENVRSSYPNNIYAVGDGTSFSAPHVAGAAALLKQINPNATSAQILRALLVTARDISTPGEDNNSGRGVINVLAAKDSLPASAAPGVFVSDYSFVGDANNAPDPGEQLTLSSALANAGANAYGVKLTLHSNSPLAVVTDSTALFGDIPKNDTILSTDFTGFSVSSSAQPGEKLPFSLTVTDDSGYSATYPWFFYVTAKPLESKANHDKGNFVLTISNFGQYGFASGSVNPGIAPDTGLGFKYPKAGSNNLFEAAVMFGLLTGQVSDAARDYVGFLPDSDFAVSPGGNLVLDTISASRKSDQDGFCIFTDQKAESPIGIKVTQRSYVFSDTANDDYVIIEYTIHNETGLAISGLRAAYFTDFDFPWGSGGSDRAGFVRSKQLGYMNQSNNTLFRGIVVTDTLGITSYRAIENPNFIYDGFSDLEKWQFMSGGFADTVNTTNVDGSILAATGPWDIPAGDSVKTSFALVGANNLNDLQTFAQRAIDKYQTYLTACVAAPGDLNADNVITLPDIIYLVNYVFDKDRVATGCLGASPGNCWSPAQLCRADVDGSGSILLNDIIFLVNYVFDKERPATSCLGSSPGNCWTPPLRGVCCLAL